MSDRVRVNVANPSELLRLPGIGPEQAERIVKFRAQYVPIGNESELSRVLASGVGPAIVVAQVGEVNTGAIDAMPEVVRLAREHRAWCHVDGAFGLWAAASPALQGLTEGVAGADSWATDAHKLLNVPYDSGIAIVRDREAHAAAMNSFAGAEYIPPPAPNRPPLSTNSHRSPAVFPTSQVFITLLPPLSQTTAAGASPKNQFSTMNGRRSACATPTVPATMATIPGSVRWVTTS